MVFSSITFLFYFLPIVLIIYYLMPNKLKNVVLLVASLLFYFWGEPKYIVVMIFSIILAYIFGNLIDKYKNSKYRVVFMIIPILISVGILIYFKYANFIIKNINLYLSQEIDLINVILPIGISFYTFQLISYIVDVYRGDVKPQKNILKLATYVCLFPQLIAGPIVRYKDIEKQLEKRECNIDKFSAGVRRFIIGLGKKVLIANVVGNLVTIFLASNEKSVLFYWMYGISVMLQIYFDFSGYSDMAIGLGKMFGFEFLENFNYPYIAQSITDFWRRWHISLSTWFRDYIYIPLGGNKVSKLKWIRNLMVVWCLTGLWHGAEWNFVVWGLYFGIILIIEKLFLLKYSEKIPKPIKRIYTILIVMISFIIFNGSALNEAIKNIGGLFGIGNVTLLSNESIYYFKSYFIIILVGILASTPIAKNICLNKKMNKIINILEPIFLLVIFMISTSYIIDGSFNPFLYFRF